jgi:hypothetical protein
MENHLVAVHRYARLVAQATIAKRATAAAPAGPELTVVPMQRDAEGDARMSKTKETRSAAAARKCRLCRKRGHRANACPTAGNGRGPRSCGYCHRPDGTHSAGCKRKRQGGTSQARSMSPNGALAAAIAQVQDEIARRQQWVKALRKAEQLMRR